MKNKYKKLRRLSKSPKYISGNTLPKPFEMLSGGLGKVKDVFGDMEEKSLLKMATKLFSKKQKGGRTPLRRRRKYQGSGALVPVGMNVGNQASLLQNQYYPGLNTTSVLNPMVGPEQQQIIAPQIQPITMSPTMVETPSLSTAGQGLELVSSAGDINTNQAQDTSYSLMETLQGRNPGQGDVGQGLKGMGAGGAAGMALQGIGAGFGAYTAAKQRKKMQEESGFYSGNMAGVDAVTGAATQLGGVEGKVAQLGLGASDAIKNIGKAKLGDGISHAGVGATAAAEAVQGATTGFALGNKIIPGLGGVVGAGIGLVGGGFGGFAAGKGAKEDALAARDKVIKGKTEAANLQSRQQFAMQDASLFAKKGSKIEGKFTDNQFKKFVQEAESMGHTPEEHAKHIINETNDKVILSIAKKILSNNKTLKRSKNKKHQSGAVMAFSDVYPSFKSGGSLELESLKKGGKKKPQKKLKKKSGIYIKPENRGKFTRWCKKQGHDGPTTACIKEGLESDDPGIVKMANFARNSQGWKKGKGKKKKAIGGNMDRLGMEYIGPYPDKRDISYQDLMQNTVLHRGQIYGLNPKTMMG